MPSWARRTASAPGRVTLLGEHTDYNEGLSLGVATPQRTVATAEADHSGVVIVDSSDLGVGSCAIDRADGPSFAVLAAALARQAGLGGARVEVTSDLPVGVGMSSSAAYAVAIAIALGVEGDPITLATACQAAERDAGSDVGLLDQLVVLAASPGRVVDIDFRGPTVTALAMPASIGLSVVDTGAPRTLVTTAYAQRRAECASAAARIGAPLGSASMREVETIDDGLLRRRARHVVSECARVREARTALALGDLGAFGALLDEGHASLRDDFDVSTPRVESTRDEVVRVGGVTGARLCGAGFGGCLIVAHDPDIVLSVAGHWTSRIEPGGGASLSSTS